MAKGITVWTVVAMTMSVGIGSAQTPQPFPRPSAPPTPAPSSPAPSAPQGASTPATSPPGTAGAPTTAMLGAPLYPSSVFLASYDAGRGQRFYLFGVMLPYADAVNYYKTALKQKGDELFESPLTYQFELAKFRDDQMAFPPSVTVKDYTYGGAAGYPNPVAGAEPARFPTIVQVVPPPR